MTDGSLPSGEKPRFAQPVARFIARRGWLIVIAAILGHLGAWHWALDLFSHFRWQYFFAFVLCACAATYARERLLLGMCLLGGLSQFALIAQFPFSKPTESLNTEKSSPLRVLVANCAMATRATQLLHEINERRPDIVGLVELSPELAQSLSTALAERYSLQRLFPDVGWQGTGVLVRDNALRNPSAELLPETQFEFPTIRLTFGDVELLLVHPIPPVSESAAQARDQFFADLAHYSQNHSGTGTLMIAGDFNATPWSAPFRKLLSSGGLQDSVAGFWPFPTWHGPNTFFGPLSIPIDQFLYRGPMQIRARQVLSNPDSDHSMLWIEAAAVPSQNTDSDLVI